MNLPTLSAVRRHLRWGSVGLALGFAFAVLLSPMDALAQVGLCKAGAQCNVRTLQTLPATNGAGVCVDSANARWTMQGSTSTLTIGGYTTATAACGAGTLNNAFGQLSLSVNSAGFSTNGPARGPDGTAAGPTWTFTNETGTGFYRLANGQVGFAASGVAAGSLRMSSSGLGVYANSGNGHVSADDASGAAVLYGVNSVLVNGSNVILASAGQFQFNTGSLSTPIPTATPLTVTDPDGLKVTPVADASAFPNAGANSATLLTEGLLNHYWYTDGFAWRDHQSGPHPVLDSNVWSASVGLETAACPLINQNVPDATGIASAVACTQSATALTFADAHNYRRQQSAAVTGNQATFITTNAITEARLRPRVCALVYTGSATNQRFYVGVGSALPTANVAGANPTAALAASSAVIRWSAANDSTRWLLATSDGATTSTATFGANGALMTAAHSYRVCVDLRNAGTIIGSIQDLTTGLESRVAKTTNLPVAATQLKPFVVAESEANTVADLGVSAMSVETN